MTVQNLLWQAPAALCGATFTDQTGTVYAIPANGQISLPSTSAAAALAAGFSLIVGSAALYATNAATSAATATVGSIGSPGANDLTLNMTGTLGAGAALTLPTVAALLATLPNAVPGQSWNFRLLNTGGGAFAWTLTTSAGWGTLGGTQSVAQNTWRDFIITITSVSAATGTVQSVGVGTNS